MHQFVGHDVAIPVHLVLSISAVGSYWFSKNGDVQPDAAHPVGHGEEDVVMIEGVRAEQGVCLVHQLFEGGEVLRLQLQIFGRIGHAVQADIIIDIPLTGIFPGENRRIDQRFVIDFFPAHRVARAGLAVERGEHLPAFRHLDRRQHFDATRVMAFGIQAHRFPLQVEHFLRHRDGFRRR